MATCCGSNLSADTSSSSHWSGGNLHFTLLEKKRCCCGISQGLFIYNEFFAGKKVEEEPVYVVPAEPEYARPADVVSLRPQGNSETVLVYL